MLMGRYLLEDAKIELAALDHRNFASVKDLIEKNVESYYSRAVEAIKTALAALYKDQEVSLQRLSATFRREDLIEFLDVPKSGAELLVPPAANPVTHPQP